MRVIVSIAVVLGLAASAGCAGKKQATVTEGLAALSPLATFNRAKEQMDRHQMRQAVATLKRIQYTPEVREEIEPSVRLALADATFYQSTALAWIDARNLYLDFVTLYGDHEMAPYAQTQAGRCSLKQVNHPSRDQSQTLQAIRDLEVVQARFPDSIWAKAARKLLAEARSNLAESEYLVGKFYIKRKRWAAAIDRLSRLLDEYPTYVRTDQVLFHLGRAHLQGGNETEARIYLDKYLVDHPDGELAAEAKKLLASAGGPLRPGPNADDG